MKHLICSIILLCVVSTSYGQNHMNIYGAEIYRVGKIISAEKTENGSLVFSSEDNEISHITTNFIVKETIDDMTYYGEVDLSFVTTLLTLQTNQNYNSSLSLLVGAYLNEEPLELGPASTYLGFGADFDGNFSRINVDNTNRSVDAGTIGFNSRLDVEFGDAFFIHNSVSRGWWKSTQAKKWDIKSMIGLNLARGFSLGYSLNYMSFSKDYEDKFNNSIFEKSKHRYNNFIVMAIF